MKRFWWLLLGALILIIGGFFYFKQKHNEQGKVGERFIYNQATQKWEKYDGEDIFGKDRGSIVEIFAIAAEQLLLSPQGEIPRNKS